MSERARSLLLGLAVLPLNVLGLIPLAVLYVSSRAGVGHRMRGPGDGLFWAALLLAAGGLLLMVWTVALFFRWGRGTPAPWDPPRELVIMGPYRHVRNPMISGVLLGLLAEALLFGSWPLFVWFLVFFLGNALYLPRVEEKSLERRFGGDYILYKLKVPRWVPRLRPWDPPGQS